MKFEKAVRRKAKLRLALSGPSGSGKTLSALLLAKGIGGRIAVIDTERDSASLYAESVSVGGGRKIDTPEFDSLNLSAPYSPERYIDAIKAAADAGYSVLIIDSITHEWSGVGGCLELVDDIAKARFRGNSWSAWNEVTPRHRAFVDAILQSPIHVIVTMRSKTETAQQENQNGKKTVVKLGMKAEQRDGFEYEMSAVLDLTHDGHFATATKDRTGLFMGQDPVVVTAETGARLLAWLEHGAEEQKTGMSAEDVDKYIKAIAEAADIESLNAAATAALEAATDANDREGYKRLLSVAKDCKTALEQKEAA